MKIRFISGVIASSALLLGGVTPAHAASGLQPVTNVSVVRGLHSLAFSWTAPVGAPGGLQYSVTVEDTEENQWICQVNAPATSCTVTGLPSEHDVDYFVEAYLDSPTWSLAGPFYTSTLAFASAPSAPGVPSADAGDGQATVSWSAPG